jgi:hypothetical protein
MLLADGLKSADESSSTAEGKTMEATELDRMGRRKTLDAFERGITGGHHIGHLPLYVQEIEGWIFRRCRCGFTLALTPNGAILWLKITKPAIEINNFTSLLRAVNSDCWAHPRPEPSKHAAITASPVAEAAAKTNDPRPSENAICSGARQASMEIARQSKANRKDSDPILRVEQTPPIKRRKTYIPNNATQRTRPR